MVDPDRTRFACDGSLVRRYLGELAKTRHIGGLLDGAVLNRVWGCDASLYDTSESGGPRQLIVGDAGSFIDPMSSFGVKKALTSAWMGAAVVRTCLTDPAIEPAARGMLKREIAIKEGIDSETARDVVKMIKEKKLKVQAAIQDQQVRVTGKKIDDLQEVIQMLRGANIPIPLQFVNMQNH